MKTLREIWKFAFGKAEEMPPSPYHIALTLTAALLSSGRFGDDGGAACDTAWTLIIPFYQGRVKYEKQTRILFDLTQHASAPEPDMTRAEARAYVTGGETGEMGEAGALPPMAVKTMASAPGMVAFESIDLEEIRAKQVTIQACTNAVHAAEAALILAKREGTKAQIAAAQKAFDLAAERQSAAYL